MPYPLGIRNNNPGNIVYNSRNDWQGQTAPNGRFCVFDTPEYGIRAMAKVLASYQRKGLNNLKEMIDRWAPPFENDTSAYVTSVCQRTELKPDTVVTREHYPALIAAIILHENGQQPYTADVITAGLQMAFGD